MATWLNLVIVLYPPDTQFLVQVIVLYLPDTVIGLGMALRQKLFKAQNLLEIFLMKIERKTTACFLANYEPLAFGQVFDGEKKI